MVCYLPLALFAQFFLALAYQRLLNFSDFLSFSLRTHFRHFRKKMSRDKKVAAETKLSEEEKLLEEKTAGFVESIAKKIQRR